MNTRAMAPLVSAGIVLVGLHALADPFALSLANQVLLACIGALALTLLMGAAGLISLGQAAILGAGGFTVGVLSQELGAPVWVTLPASVLVGGFLGLVAGLPSLRVRGVYLALSTLGLHFAVVYLGSEYQSHRRAATGIVIADPALGPLVLNDPRAWLWLLAGLVVLSVALCRALLKSRTGRAWMALREGELAARSTGVNVGAYKVGAFIVSSGMTSFAGALGAYYHHFVAVEGYTFFLAIQYLAMVLIGGVGSVAGALTGAALVILLPQLVSAGVGLLPLPPQFKLYSFAVQYLLVGLLMASFILFLPGGLVSLWHRRARHARSQSAAPSRPVSAADTNPALLEVSDLCVMYGPANAVEHVSLRVERGSIVAVLGANGAGKSTTLRAISGLLPTDSARLVRGDVRFSGRSISGWSPERAARAGVVLVPERDKIFSTLTVEQNLAVTSASAPSHLLESTLRHFPVLAERRRMLAGYLSGGERQMLALACALLCQPRVLLVDELSLGLAPGLVRRLLRTLDDLRRELGLAVVLVEQNASAALAVADYAYVLSGCRVVKHGQADALARDSDVESVYLGLDERRAS
jgi:branched-chain amino acid transport system permease protein